jgi:hypothetical protein
MLPLLEGKGMSHVGWDTGDLPNLEKYATTLNTNTRTPVVISRAFFSFFPCDHIIIIKKKILFPAK